MKTLIAAVCCVFLAGCATTLQSRMKVATVQCETVDVDTNVKVDVCLELYKVQTGCEVLKTGFTPDQQFGVIFGCEQTPAAPAKGAEADPLQKTIK